MRKLTALIILLASTLHLQAQSPFEAWHAGEKVTAQQIGEYGLERCFASLPVDDATFARMSGKSFKKNCTMPRAELRYLRVLHYDLAGEIRLGELVCNKVIANDLTEIFRILYNARYPIERMVLIDEYEADDERSMAANNSSAFNFRFFAGTTRLSKHSTGMAVDINPLYNPYVRTREGRTIIEPQGARPYVDRSKDFPCKIDTSDLCYKEFVKRGFEWGGSWKSSKDYQHFEKR